MLSPSRSRLRTCGHAQGVAVSFSRAFYETPRLLGWGEQHATAVPPPFHVHTQNIDHRKKFCHSHQSKLRLGGASTVAVFVPLRVHVFLLLELALGLRLFRVFFGFDLVCVVFCIYSRCVSDVLLIKIRRFPECIFRRRKISGWEPPQWLTCTPTCRSTISRVMEN